MFHAQDPCPATPLMISTCIVHLKCFMMQMTCGTKQGSNWNHLMEKHKQKVGINSFESKDHCIQKHTEWVWLHLNFGVTNHHLEIKMSNIAHASVGHLPFLCLPRGGFWTYSQSTKELTILSIVYGVSNKDHAGIVRPCWQLLSFHEISWKYL